MDADRGRFSFRSRRTRGANAEFDAQYSPEGSLFEPEPGTLDYFLTERYCFYTQDAANNAYRVEIHHAPWQVQSAAAEVRINTMPDAAGLRLPSMAPVLHYARRQDVMTWSPHRLQ